MYSACNRFYLFHRSSYLIASTIPLPHSIFSNLCLTVPPSDRPFESRFALISIHFWFFIHSFRRCWWWWERIELYVSWCDYTREQRNNRPHPFNEQHRLLEYLENNKYGSNKQANENEMMQMLCTEYLHTDVEWDTSLRAHNVDVGGAVAVVVVVCRMFIYRQYNERETASLTSTS